MIKKPPIPSDDAARVAALRRLAILDTEREASFDRLVQLASRQFRVPIALISLIDKEREWFKASCGFGRMDLDRDLAFCTYTILDDEVMVVPDARLDPRFCDNPLVTGEPHIRFYAGAPIYSAEGYKIGTICLVDSEPHPDFSADDEALLADLAAITSDQIQIRYEATDVLTEVESRIKVENDLASAENWLSLFLRYSPVAVAMFDREMHYVAASRQWRELFGIEGLKLVGQSPYDVAQGAPTPWRQQNETALANGTFSIEEHWVTRPDGSHDWIERQVRPWRDANGEIGGLVVFAEVITGRKDAEAALQKNRNFLETVLQNVQDGIVVCDEAGKLTLFNGAARAFHGVDASPMPPEQWSQHYDLYRADGKTPLETAEIPLFRALQGEVVSAQEMVIAPHGKPARTLVAQAKPLFDVEGRKIGAVASMHDVTRERLAKEQLSATTARYRAIFENSFQLCSLISLDGTVMEVNQTALDFLGRTRDETMGMNLWDGNWWGGRSGNRSELQDAFRKACEGEFIRFETDISGARGRTMPIDFSLMPVMSDDGKVINVLAEGRDMSDKKRRDTELRRREAELELILDHAPARIIYKEEDGRIIRLNSAAARAINRKPEELEGRYLSEFAPRFAEKVQADDALVFAAGQPSLGAVEEYIARDGARSWVKTDRVPHIDPATGRRYMFVVSTDISAEKRAEEALIRSKERYRSLYNKTPVMLHSIDRNGRLLSISDFWLERLGYERDEVIGRKSSEFLTPESARKAIEEVLPVFMQTGTCKDVEYQMVTKTGEIVDILLSAVSEYNADGSIERTMAVLVDITELKALYSQLIQAQKMESVGQLTGGLAHDFNNLLGVVIGNLQLMQRTVTGDDKFARRLHAALGAAERGAELTKRLLAFARRQKLETESVAVNPLIQDMSGILKGTLSNIITLDLELGGGIPNVRTDASQLETALLNLVVNARDAMPNGGRIVVESRAVRFTDQDAAMNGDLQPGDYVEISVSDTGSGIPKECLDKVFEPFFTTKQAGGGSGLGLSMIYGFIRQSGGYVKIYSEPDRGTCVRLLLPADTSQVSAVPVEHPRGSDRQGAGETILVVEDQDDVREVAVGMLEELGYRVLTASGGRDGLTVLRSAESVDLVFSDIVMPGELDGPQFAEEVRRLHPDLPVLFTTGYTEATVLHSRAIHLGRDLVTKPYRMADLAEKVRRALDKVQVLSKEPVPHV
ncbi:PAS domain S-box protein [Amorphus coralli]|uniref:PAS domain S-box protein n=1 Tax=Amorphus coralli TaxID=340680 RepID=UPI0003615B25|nr:PAS domain S-box protein [Amorphus coralli]